VTAQHIGAYCHFISPPYVYRLTIYIIAQKTTMSIVFDKKMKKNPKNIFPPEKNVFTNPHFIW